MFIDKTFGERMDYVLNLEIKSNYKFALLSMVIWAKGEKDVMISNEILCEMTSYSENVMRQHLIWLENNKYISRDMDTFKRGASKINKYTFNF